MDNPGARIAPRPFMREHLDSIKLEFRASYDDPVRSFRARSVRHAIQVRPLTISWVSSSPQVSNKCRAITGKTHMGASNKAVQLKTSLMICMVQFCTYTN